MKNNKKAIKAFYKEHYFLAQVKCCSKFGSSQSHVFFKIGLLILNAINKAVKIIMWIQCKLHLLLA